MSSSITVKFNINLEEKKRLEINDKELELLNKFFGKLSGNIVPTLEEDGAFDNAINISNVLMNKLLFSFKNKEIFNNFIENARYGDNLVANAWLINFKTLEEFSRFVIFFEKLSQKQQESFLDFLKNIYDKNLFRLKKKDPFASAEYIQMIIDIFSNKYKNIDLFYKKLVEADGFTTNLEIEEEIELNKIIDDERFKKFFEFFLKDYNEQELKEIDKQGLEAFLNSDDFKNKENIEKQPYLTNIQDENKKQEAKNKKQEIISCMEKKAEIIQTFFERRFDEKSLSSSGIQIQININEQEKKRLEINDNNKQFELLNKFYGRLFGHIRVDLDEDSAFENAQNISNALMNKLLSSFKNKEIFNNFIENAGYNDAKNSINFKTPEEFSRFVIFFEKLSQKQQESFLNFLEKIKEKNLFRVKKGYRFESAEYIQMIINIFFTKDENIDSFYLNKIIDDETFEKFFKFFLKDYNEKELEEISKGDFEKFLNSNDFINKENIKKQPYLQDITNENEKQEAKNKKQEIISCMKKKAQIIQTFFERRFDLVGKMLKSKEGAKKREIIRELIDKPKSKEQEEAKSKALINGFIFLAFDALLFGVLATKGVTNLFENKIINLCIIACCGILLAAAAIFAVKKVKKVYDVEMESIEVYYNEKSNKINQLTPAEIFTTNLNNLKIEKVFNDISGLLDNLQ